jgi:hypothetical protein
MPEFLVTVTATCEWEITVEADTEEEAEAKVTKMIDDNKLGEPDGINEHEISNTEELDE